MNISNLKFDINDAVKLIGVTCMVVTLRNDLVSEIRTNKTFDMADKRIIDYRISRVEKCCNITGVLPKELKIAYDEQE